MSDQLPAPDQSRGAISRDEARPTDPVERLAGFATRATGAGSVWGRRDQPAVGAAAPPNVAAEAAPLRPTAPNDTPAAATPPPPRGAMPAPDGRIGRLSRIKSSELWPDGSGLAAWLAASPEPLAETLGKPPFEFASSGSNVLLGTSADQHPVCVVCEVGPSSDEGLGVLLRAAAVQDGGLVIWVAGEMADAHVAALSWLNRATAPRFYLVRVTGIRIDGSASAPIFELVTRPPRAAAPAPAPAPAASASEAAAPRAAEVPRRRVEDHVPDA